MRNEIVLNEDMHFFLAQDSAETDKMIAGMRALIEENKNAYEAMKNQKWFQRIWYTITRKNSATVKEMQMNRDRLSSYCVNVLAQIVQQKALSDAMLVSLAASVRDMTELHIQLQDVVYDLAKKLDEKIISVDSYQNLITDIQNGVFNRAGSFVGVIDILSRVDERTAKDSERLKRIKETMNSDRFDFNESVHAAKLGEQVLALSEESVGRIYLFAQNHRHLDFLAYVCYLIEMYFYVLEADRSGMLEKVIHDAMVKCHLADSVSFSIDGVFEDLEKSVVDDFHRKQILKENSKDNPISSQVNARIDAIKNNVTSNRNKVIDSVNLISAEANALLERKRF